MKYITIIISLFFISCAIEVPVQESKVYAPVLDVSCAENHQRACDDAYRKCRRYSWVHICNQTYEECFYSTKCWK